ncbi:MAG: MFS transporter [Lactobacillaceae bacterium]|jgi:UMF1 family MFS transporter|nr:MFS transporter [Lactobacillaceae bacterium]
MKKFTKQEWSWIMYDWANSGYGIIVVTAVLPIWVTSVAAHQGISATHASAFWGYANSIATFIAALVAPLLGALADFRGFKSRLFYSFTLLGILGTFALALAPINSLVILLGIFIVSFLGYSSANVLYDAFITDITTDERMDNISSAGYGFGYLGGLVPFVLFVLVKDYLSGRGSVIFAFALAAIWWVLFTIPFMRNVRQTYALETVRHPVIDSLKRLWHTVKVLPQHPQLFWFLLAYFFYMDGVNTIFTIASSFALAIGIPASKLILILLIVQVVAFPFSLLFGWLADIFGNKQVLIFGMLEYIFITSFAFFIHTEWEFWVLAILVGTAQGGMQALSRSYLGQIVPKERSSEFFGFYNIFGKFSAFMGPLLYALVVSITGHVQTGAAVLGILFVIGLILFLFIPKTSEG